MLIPAGNCCQEPSAPSTHFLVGTVLALAASACASSRNGGSDAGQVEETADGRRRGARGQARGALESRPQGRIARDGGLDERAAIARVRKHQAQGTSAQ